MIARSSKCPICGRPEISETAPFCSKRCADVDLQRWLAGSYVVPGDDDSDDGIPTSSDEA